MAYPRTRVVDNSAARLTGSVIVFSGSAGEWSGRKNTVAFPLIHEREDGFAQRGRVKRIARAKLDRHAQSVATFGYGQINDAIVAPHAEIDCLGEALPELAQ